MDYILNTTDNYHINTLNTLGWELTVSNALHPENSPCRGALKNKTSFGVQLFQFLERFIPMASIKTVLEVGGGLGYLMHDMLTMAPHLEACMIDISPFLLQKQKETLSGMPARFVEADFLSMSLSDLHPFEIVILNENLGDFPTLVADRGQRRHDQQETTRWLNKIEDFREEYALDFANGENINIGALCALERICGARIPYIFLSEHSCEASLNHPEFPYCNFKGPGNPEKIHLKGHDEFTIKFSHLETIARAFRYKVVRGQYVDILPIDLNSKVRSAMRSATPLSDEQEILQQFVYDLYKYEYMVLISEPKKKG